MMLFTDKCKFWRPYWILHFREKCSTLVIWHTSDLEGPCKNGQENAKKNIVYGEKQGPEPCSLDYIYGATRQCVNA